MSIRNCHFGSFFSFCMYLLRFRSIRKFLVSDLRCSVEGDLDAANHSSLFRHLQWKHKPVDILTSLRICWTSWSTMKPNRCYLSPKLIFISVLWSKRTHQLQIERWWDYKAASMVYYKNNLFAWPTYSWLLTAGVRPRELLFWIATP